MPPTAADYIRRALRELNAERDRLDRQIEVLDRTLDELEPGGSGDAPDDSGSHGRPVRDIVMDLAGESHLFTLDEVMRRVRSEGNPAQHASVSSILSRLKREGFIDAGPRRGTYVSIDPLSEKGGDGGVLGASGQRTDDRPDPGSNP
ncbi:MAG: hypothetical protein KDB10_21090, partial [Acidimicrobiales bacterium]|nr:hypothetical protein [Acidimicrobiales bacterium]